MARGLWQPVQGAFDVVRGEPRQFFAPFSGDAFGERRTGGDRSGASAYLEPRLGDAPVFDPYRQPQDIAAGRVFDLDAHGRVFQLAAVARIAKMIQQPLAVHRMAHSRYHNGMTAKRGSHNVGPGGGCRRSYRARWPCSWFANGTPEDSHSLKWEFPGGKVEPGESYAEALKRELEEELSIQAVIGDEIARHQHQYRGRRPFLLVFLRVESFTGEPRNNVFAEIRWAKREELPGYDFLEGDREFVRSLAAGTC